MHAQHTGGTLRYDWRLLANGYIDEMLYEQDGIDTTLPFVDLRARSNIDARARAAGDDPAFSARIREGLPQPPPRP
jgi:hypothetical protein